MAKEKAHVSDAKKSELKDLIKRFKENKTLMVVSVKGLPSRQFQDIKKKVRGKATIKVRRKSLINRALEGSGIDGLKELEKYVNENCALLFSNDDAFLISGILSREKSPQKAKAGQIAPADIEVKAGPTELIPGPDISALSAVGLAPKVENGKISVMQDKVICKEGAVITEAMASIMAKLDIIPFEVGIEPVAAFMDGVVYVDIKIDSEAVVNELLGKSGRALPFAVEIGYVTSDTLDFVLAKAASYEGVITRIITGEPEPVAAVAAESESPSSDEDKKTDKVEEKPAESAAGLASLFG
jgi:large subunit ribosomal protein L10